MKDKLPMICLLLLAACEAVTSTTPDTCEAEGYALLVGANIAAVTLPASPNLRVFKEGDAVTQDFRPERTNIVFGQDGTILRVFCG